MFLFILYICFIFIITLILYFGKSLHNVQVQYQKLIYCKDYFEPEQNFTLFLLGNCILSSIARTEKNYIPLSLPLKIYKLYGKDFIGNKITAGTLVKYKKKYIISLAGTSSIPDVLTSMDLKLIDVIEGRFHKGYFERVLDLWPQVFHIINQKKITKLYLTGHSMGGALVSILSYFIETCFKHIQCIVITFGTPKYCTSFNLNQTKVYNYLNEADPVILKPLGSLTRFGKSYMFKIDTGNDNINHSIKTYKNIVLRNNKIQHKRSRRFHEIISRIVLDLFG